VRGAEVTVRRSRDLDAVSTYPSVVLEAVGVQSYAELAALGTEEVVRRLDDRKPPLHPADAFLAVMVLSALSELRETTKALDSASRDSSGRPSFLRRSGSS
jgi:hypothetical protein